MKGFLCNKREILQAKECFCKVNYAVGVLICNSVQLKESKTPFPKNKKRKNLGNLGVSIKPQIRSPRSLKTESWFIA